MDKEVDDGLIVRYLLRDSIEVELCEDEFQNIEMRYLADPGFYEQILAIEDDLIQSYANAELSDEEYLRFEQNYLYDPARFRRIRFSRNLSNWVCRNYQ
jgi:hypothetical protein